MGLPSYCTQIYQTFSMSLDPGVRAVRRTARALGYPGWEVLDLRSTSLPAMREAGASTSASGGHGQGETVSRETRRFVAFLEHRKIRALKVDERAVCDLEASPHDWLAALRAYLHLVGCPIQAGAGSSGGGDTRRRQLHWLADYALGLEFEDRKANGKLPEVTAAAAGGSSGGGGASGGESKAANNNAASLAKLDVQLRELAAVTGVDCPEGVLDDDVRLGLLHAVEVAVLQKLSGGSARATGVTGASSAKPVDVASALMGTLPPGLATGRVQVDRAVLVARMLQVGRLRLVQNAINQIVEVGQEFVANPKTDSSLGRVGR